MKVLNFEDSVYKANAIRKILGNRCGVASVEQVSNVEDGLKMLKDAENAGEPFNLIITDMHFPMRQEPSATRRREKNWFSSCRSREIRQRLSYAHPEI